MPNFKPENRFPENKDISELGKENLQNFENREVVSLNEAEKIMQEYFYGPKQIEKALGISLKNEDIPDIPFSKSDLEKAKELSQELVLYVNKDNQGVDLTIEKMELLVREVESIRKKEEKYLFEEYWNYFIISKKAAGALTEDQKNILDKIGFTIGSCGHRKDENGEWVPTMNIVRKESPNSAADRQYVRDKLFEYYLMNDKHFVDLNNKVRKITSLSKYKDARENILENNYKYLQDEYVKKYHKYDLSQVVKTETPRIGWVLCDTKNPFKQQEQYKKILKEDNQFKILTVENGKKMESNSFRNGFDYIDNIKLAVKFLKDNIFLGKEVPIEYQEAFVEFDEFISENQEKDFNQFLSKIASLKIVSLCIPSVSEVVYRIALHHRDGPKFFFQEGFSPNLDHFMTSTVLSDADKVVTWRITPSGSGPYGGYNANGFVDLFEDNWFSETNGDWSEDGSQYRRGLTFLLNRRK